MREKIKILHLEDSVKDFELMHSIIESGEIEHEYFLTDNEKDFVNLLETENIDVILADYNLPDYNGNEALKFVKEKYSFIPFIFVSGTIGEDVAISAMLNGATDYVLKNKLERLIPAIKRALKERENNNIKIEAEEALRASEEKFKAIYQYSNDAIMLLDRNGFFDCNPQTLKLFKINSKEEFKKLSPIDLSPPVQSDGTNSNEASEENIRIAYRDGFNRFNWIHRRANGEDFIADVLLSAFDYCGERALQVTVRDITERKIAEEAIENSDKQYRLLFNEMLSGFALHEIICDQSGKPTDYRFLSVNKTFEKMTGLNASNILGKTVLEVLLGVEYSWIERYGKVALTGEPIHFENFAAALGKHYEVSAYCPGPGKFATLINDITERKNAEDAITSERRMLRTLIDNLPDVIYVKDIDCRKIIANKADVLNLGFEKEAAVLGKTDIELFQGQTGLRGYNDDKNVINLGKAIIEREEDFVNKNGVRRWLLTSKLPLQNKDGIITGLVGIGHDITNRKIAEAELLQSYVFSETLLKTIPFGMDIVDETGTVLFQSESFKEIFGKSAIGNKCWELYRDDKKQCSDCPLLKGITIGETETYESNGVLGSRIFEISYTGMQYEGKKAMLEIFQDITERKGYEASLIRAKEQAEESDNLKTAFLSNMSHEIRTPMNGILGFTNLLKKPNLTGEEQQEFINIIQISGARMLNTINNIVDISKIESGLIGVNIKETNIDEKIEFTYKFFKPEVENKGLQFFFKNNLLSKETIIKTDNEKVYGILTNLVRNAIKFTLEGSIEFGYEKKGEYIEFFVKDTGIGIPENQKELIFERFRQGSESYNRNYEGSGLGLSISKSYVEMLGGSIWVESEEGKGSTFYFTIPYHSVEEENTEIKNVVPAELKEVQMKNLKILIVEDDEVSYSLLTRILQNISKKVLHEITGIKAIETCRNNPDLDLVLMDIKMPQMDGSEATRQIRQFNKDIVIIAQTAYAFADDNEKAIEAGCNDYIAKPIDKTLLYDLINKHCNKQNEQRKQTF
jgi:hypothetical protein